MEDRNHKIMESIKIYKTFPKSQSLKNLKKIKINRIKIDPINKIKIDQIIKIRMNIIVKI